MALKIILIILFMLAYQILGYFSVVPGASGGVLLRSVATGIIMGDYATGLAMGGTYELMNIGLNPLGESAVPNYNLGAIVGTFYAITVDSATGTAMGIVVATLATMLNTFSYYPSLIFKSLMEKALQNHNWKMVQVWEIINWIPAWIIGTAIPVAVVCGAGQALAEALISYIPDWLTNGFTVAGNALPALGFAIVLRSMSVSKNFEYLIIGFVLYAYMGVDTVGAALVGGALALMAYKQAKEVKSLQASAVVGGGLGDE